MGREVLIFQKPITGGGMGYIRLLKKDGKKVLLDSSMNYLILINKEKEEIKHMKVESLINFLEENGQKISWEELRQIETKLKEEKHKWWKNYKKTLPKNKEGGKQCLQENK